MSLLLTLPASGSNDDNILIGMHSLSGAMGTSELALKDAVFMLIVDFKSEGRPASSRDRRRLRVGISGRIKSESVRVFKYLKHDWRATPNGCAPALI
jgi:hypothetical protein